MIRSTNAPLHRRLRQINLPDQMWVFQWFITFFIYSFPIAYIQDMIAFVAEEKQLAVVKLGIGVIKCLESLLMSFHETQEDEYI